MDESNDNHSNIEMQTIANVKRLLIDTQINTQTVNVQDNPKVSSLSDGNFIVVWQSNLENVSGWSIYGQIFYSNNMFLTIRMIKSIILEKTRII